MDEALNADSPVGTAQRLEDLFNLIQEVAFVHVTNQWRLVEIELAKLQTAQPEAFQTITQAWADDGWLVRPPWAPQEPDD